MCTLWLWMSQKTSASITILFMLKWEREKHMCCVCSLASQDKSRSCKMLMFSLLELLNAQRTREKRDSFQFSQSGHLQVHAFDKGSPLTKQERGNWCMTHITSSILPSDTRDGWRELWRGGQDGNEKRETGHEDTSHEYFSWGTDCKKSDQDRKHVAEPKFFYISICSGLLLGQWYIVCYLE